MVKPVNLPAHMTAKEARDRTNNAILSEKYIALRHIHYCIETACNTGQSFYQWIIPVNMSEETLQTITFELEKDGYKIEKMYTLSRLQIIW